MSRAGRIAVWAAAGAMLAGLLLAAAVLVLSRTDFGQERVRRFTVQLLGDRLEGELRVEHISSPGGLFGGATLHGFSLDDPDGRPFIRADSAILSYDWRTLVAGRVVLDRLALFSPVIVLERLPGWDRWNFERALGGPDTLPEQPGGPRSLVLLEDVTIRDGQVIVRTPWEPDDGEPVEPEDTARLILEDVPGGIARVMRFDALQAELPRLLVETPEGEGQLFEIAALATRGHIWKEPFVLEALRGEITLRDSILAFDAPAFRLPASNGSAVGELVLFGDEFRMDVRIEGDEVALADFRWLYPPLPEEGRGSMVFRMQTQSAERTLWYAEDLTLTTPGTRLAGSFGLVTGDTLYFTRVNLRASPLDVQLLDRILPIDLPVEGLLVGTVEVEGPLSALRTRGDVRLAQRVGAPDPQEGKTADNGNSATAAGRTGSSSARWSGTLDVRGGRPRLRSLTADVDRLDPALVEALRPGSGLPAGLSGRLSLRGEGAGAVRFDGLLRRTAPGVPEARAAVAGTFRPGPEGPYVDAVLTPDALPLAALADLFGRGGAPEGELGGTVRLSGTREDLAVSGTLETPGGALALDGRIALGGAPGFRGVLELEGFELQAVVPGAPETRLTGRVQLDASGVELERLEGELRAHFQPSRVAGVEVEEAEVRARARDGTLVLDTLWARGGAGHLAAAGELGLVEGRAGSVQWTVALDSLAALRPLVFPDTGLPEDGAPARVEGRIAVAGRLSGSLARLEATARATAGEVVVGDARTEGGTVELAARDTGAGPPEWRATVNLQASELRGFRVNGVLANLREGAEGGQGSLNAGAPGGIAYHLSAGWRRGQGVLAVDLERAALRAERRSWSLAGPARVTFGGEGLRVEGLELARTGGEGRVRAAGALPWGGGGDAGADFVLDLEAVPVGELLELAQSAAPVAGVVTGRLEVQGVASAPLIRAEARARSLGVADALLEQVDGVARYADRALELEVQGHHGERVVFSAKGRVPLDLAFTAVDRRRLPEPLRLTLSADTLPLVVLTSMVGGFTEVEGALNGALQAGGTTAEPRLEGHFALRGGAFRWAATGVRYRGLSGALDLSGERGLDVSLRALAGEGWAEVSGTIGLAELTNPTFDLRVRARGFDLARRRDVELSGDGELTLRGEYRRPLVAGRLVADGGALNLDEIWRSYQVVELNEDLLYAVVDTAAVSVRHILPASQGVFLRNMVVDADVAVGRDVWLRSRQMNVELTGDVQVDFDRRADDLRLTGSLRALRGIYQLYGRRFEVESGQVEFVGTPGVDPNLRIVAVYRARTAQNEPLDISARVSGTLLSPRVSLTSEAEPPIAESDLVSYLIFGRPTYALGAAEAQQFGRLGLGAVAPSLIGLAATNLETVAQTVGIADYLAITADELAAGNPADAGLGGLLPAARFNVGWYLSEELFLALSQRVAGGASAQQPTLRLEWRFRPTWTLEAFSEDRFANTPTQSVFELKRVYGLFLFREWGY